MNLNPNLITITRMLPGEAENGVGMNRSVREGKKCRSNGLDTALYKNYLFYNRTPSYSNRNHT